MIWLKSRRRRKSSPIADRGTRWRSKNAKSRLQNALSLKRKMCYSKSIILGKTLFCFQRRFSMLNLLLSFLAVLAFPT